MYTKESMSNLVLGALLLTKEIANFDTDVSKEAKVLRTHFDVGFRGALIDMDLDATSDQVTLQLIEEDPNSLWGFSYKYPAACVNARRIQSPALIDDRDSRIPYQVRTKNNQKCIFTNEENAILEFVSKDVPLHTLSSPAGLAAAWFIAGICTPFIVGKGAKSLREQIKAQYIIYKTEAQEHDSRENFIFLTDQEQSEFVKARTS
jgi:hypothetical protein